MDEALRFADAALRRLWLVWWLARLEFHINRREYTWNEQENGL